MNDDLEVGLAAGMDVPTAMVSSEQGSPPGKSGCGFYSLLFLIMWMMILILNYIRFEKSKNADSVQSIPTTAEKGK